VGEIKKGRYAYYHCTGYKCTGYKGKCPEPYTREEVLEKAFAGLLKESISFRFDQGSGRYPERLRKNEEARRGAGRADDYNSRLVGRSQN
jgi:recombinase-like zinc beta ribbon protein